LVWPAHHAVDHGAGHYLLAIAVANWVAPESHHYRAAAADIGSVSLMLFALHVMVILNWRKSTGFFRNTTVALMFTVAMWGIAMAMEFGAVEAVEQKRVYNNKTKAEIVFEVLTILSAGLAFVFTFWRPEVTDFIYTYVPSTRPVRVIS